MDTPFATKPRRMGHARLVLVLIGVDPLVGGVAAPGPIAGVGSQIAFDWVVVNVADDAVGSFR